jgi:hypothetical protein
MYMRRMFTRTRARSCACVAACSPEAARDPPADRLSRQPTPHRSGGRYSFHPFRRIENVENNFETEKLLVPERVGLCRREWCDRGKLSATRRTRSQNELASAGRILLPDGGGLGRRKVVGSGGVEGDQAGQVVIAFWQSASVGTMARRMKPAPDWPKLGPGTTRMPRSERRAAYDSLVSPSGTRTHR